jgi:hypothetical protein
MKKFTPSELGNWLFKRQVEDDTLMRKTFIEMGLNFKDLTHVHDTFHDVIPGRSSTPIMRIYLEVCCGVGDNKCRKMLMFEVASFDISYNCILGRPFLLKVMAIIHTSYATGKMPGPKGVITIKANQHDALACENATLTHAGHFGEKAVQEQAAKVAKTEGGSNSLRSSMSKPLIIDSPRPPSAKKGTYTASPSTQQPANQPADDTKKGADDKEILADPSNPDKKLRIST